MVMLFLFRINAFVYTITTQSSVNPFHPVPRKQCVVEKSDNIKNILLGETTSNNFLFFCYMHGFESKSVYFTIVSVTRETLGP
jgi:hypothetical protein